MKKRELELIRMLSLEDRAKETKKAVSFSVFVVLFLTFLGFGLYYWFGREFIFSYRDVSPFWGFIIFTAIGIILNFLIDRIYSLYWSDYNKVINDANLEISNILKNSDVDSVELVRLKKEYIERKIGRELLTEEEFVWHTSIYCWGCGKKHISPPVLYQVHRENGKLERRCL